VKSRAVFAGLSILGVALPAASTAGAALNDRAGDPVVFSGKDVPRLVGAPPSKIVAFAWRGRWKQIPMQIDERKTVSVRDLYPTPAPRYVRAPDTTFELEVYADGKTRTGADPKRWLDVNDEIALMAQDAGWRVRSGRVAAPRGTVSARATMMAVKDRLNCRNQENPAGVTVDGTPDVLEQPETSDFDSGKVFWEQLSGPQGSVSTIASVETNIPTPNFGSYYLDDAVLPLTGNRRQCAGDGVSYGASGFGILGPVTPNTDPRLHVDPLTEPNSLTLDRVRYFGSPQAGAANAAVFADRVRVPLTVNSARFVPKKKARR
jgi:hypothetical protein